MRSVVVCCVIVLLFTAPSLACPPVAVGGAAAAQVITPAPAFGVTAPLVGQAVTGVGYSLASGVASLPVVAQPVAIAQPVTVAASQLAAVQVGCATGSCGRAVVRSGIAGGRTRLLPRQRVVSKMVVR